LKILVVEDDKYTNEVLSNFLKHGGYEVLSAFTGKQALEFLDMSTIHLAVLDIMLPDTNGIELLKHLREFSEIPIIMLTAVTDEYSQMTSFSYKADEYVTKPFSPAVMTKRIDALIHRVYNTSNKPVNIMGYLFDFEKYTVTKDNNEISLTKKEMDIVKTLYDVRYTVLSRQSLLNKIWGYDNDFIDRTVDTHIKNIRRKSCKDLIVTVKGVGYRLNQPDDR